MSIKEMLLKLKELGVIGWVELENDGRLYVEGLYMEDSESYYGSAHITLDKDGNCVKIEER